MTNSHSKFSVKYRFPLYISVFAWAFGWVTLANVFADPQDILKNSPGFWFDVLFWVGAVLICGILGPYASIKYSMSITIRDQVILLTRYFGWSKKFYRMADISKVEVHPQKHKSPATLRIFFASGDVVAINSYANKYAALSSFLSGH